MGSRSVRHVTIDDLGKGELAVFRHEIEGLRLDAGRFHRLPFHVITGEFRIGCRLGLFGDRLDGRGAIDGLLGAGNIGEPDEEQVRTMGRARWGIEPLILTSVVPT